MKIKLDTQVAHGRIENPFYLQGQRSRSSYISLFTPCKQDIYKSKFVIGIMVILSTKVAYAKRQKTQTQ